MALFSIVHDVGGERRVYIQEAGSLIFARLHAGIADLGGAFVEVHALDDETAREVPAKIIGRMLSDRESHALLNRIG